MAAQPRSLAGKVVAITGAARGIGRATAAALVKQGARVSIGDIDVELAQRTAEELGARAVAFDLNVTDRSSFASFLERTEQALGPVDVLINNAGIMPVGRFLDESDASAARQIDINLTGVIFGMKLALPGMLARGGGHLVNIASGAGKAGVPGIATYAATKHAVVGLTEAVHFEHIDDPVDFSVVMPQVVKTELGAGVKDTRFLKAVEPEDVADAIVEALRRPRFEVYVPRVTGALVRLAAVSPRKVRERFGQLLGTDRLMVEADTAERAAYEARAARSEPGREPGAESPTASRPAEGDPGRPAEPVSSP